MDFIQLNPIKIEVKTKYLEPAVSSRSVCHVCSLPIMEGKLRYPSYSGYMHAQCAMDRFAHLARAIRYEISAADKNVAQVAIDDMFASPKHIEDKLMAVDLDKPLLKKLDRALKHYTVFYQQWVKRVIE